MEFIDNHMVRLNIIKHWRILDPKSLVCWLTRGRIGTFLNTPKCMVLATFIVMID